jgi:DNA-binding IclR family transcriptional regulator
VGQVGVPLPVHCGASAQVLLAEVGPRERAGLIEESRRHYGSLPDFDQASWVANLENVRVRGWAASASEREPGVSAIAAPVRDRRGVTVAAVAVTGPSVRMERHDRDALRGAVMTAAARISRDYGAPLEPGGRRDVRKRAGSRDES